MRLNKIQSPNGGFEIAIKAVVFFLEIRITEGVIKSPYLEDTAVQGGYRREPLYST